MKKTILASLIGATAFTALVSGQALGQEYFYRYPIANTSNDDGSGGSTGSGGTDTGGTETGGDTGSDTGNETTDPETGSTSIGISYTYTSEGQIEFVISRANLDISQPVNFTITSTSSDTTYDISGTVYYNESGDVISLTSNAPNDNYTYVDGGWRLWFDISMLERVKNASSFTISVEGVDDIGAVYTDNSYQPNIYYANTGFYQYIDTTGSCDTGYSKKYQFDGEWTDVCYKNVVTRSESTVNSIGPDFCPSVGAYDSTAGGSENISEGYTYVYPEGDTYNYSYPSGSEYYDSCVLGTVYEEPISEIYVAEVTFSNLAVNDSKQLSFDYVADDIDFGSGIEVILSSSSGTDSFFKYDKYGSVSNYDISSIYSPNENLNIEMSYTDLGGVAGQDTATVLMPEVVEETGGTVNVIESIVAGFADNRYEVSLTNAEIDFTQPIQLTAYFNDYQGAVDIGFTMDQVYFDGEVVLDGTNTITSNTVNSSSYFSNIVQLETGDVDLIKQNTNTDSLVVDIVATDTSGNTITQQDSLAL